MSISILYHFVYLMSMDKVVIWLIRGSQRKEIFVNIPENLFLSNKLRKVLNNKLKLNLSLREMSRHLRDFEKRAIITCMNKEDPYNKIYQLTNKGKKLKKDLIKTDL